VVLTQPEAWSALHLHRGDRLASRVGDLHLMAIAVGVDPDDGIYDLCQHGHAA
jgi:hypothetical protein